MDIKTPEERSINMSHIPSSNTVPEEIVRKYLFSHGFRYRKNDRRYPGKPDIVLPKYHTVIFVNGCFWHAHNCPGIRLPKSNVEFWRNKISKTVERDKRNTELLKEQGWNVITVWECELKKKIREETLSKLCDTIKNGINREN